MLPFYARKLRFVLILEFWLAEAQLLDSCIAIMLLASGRDFVMYKRPKSLAVTFHGSWLSDHYRRASDSELTIESLGSWNGHEACVYILKIAECIQTPVFLDICQEYLGLLISKLSFVIAIANVNET